VVQWNCCRSIPTMWRNLFQDKFRISKIDQSNQLSNRETED
jgi:hypothetical protein